MGLLRKPIIFGNICIDHSPRISNLHTSSTTGHQPWGRYVKSIGPAALAGYFLGVAGVLGQQAGKGNEGW